MNIRLRTCRNLSHLIFWIKSLFFPTWANYGLVHVDRQPEREICGKKKDLKIQWGEK